MNKSNETGARLCPCGGSPLLIEGHKRRAERWHVVCPECLEMTPGATRRVTAVVNWNDGIRIGAASTENVD